jgi:hypothetical protein
MNITAVIRVLCFTNIALRLGSLNFFYLVTKPDSLKDIKALNYNYINKVQRSVRNETKLHHARSTQYQLWRPANEVCRACDRLPSPSKWPTYASK